MKPKARLPMGRQLYPSEYNTWLHMKRRCDNPSCPGYKSYGARGITVCERWRESFWHFIADMGPRPTQDHEIDREDNDGNYELGNCRWATKNER